MIIRDIVFSTTPPALHNVLWIKAGDNNINTLYVYDGGWRKIGTSSGEGTSNYNDLENKPKINNVILEGNLSLEELGIIIPDLKNYVTEGALNIALLEYAKKSDIPSIEGLLSEVKAQELYQPKGNYALKSDIPDTSGLASKDELSEAISNQKFKTINGQEITGEGNIEIQEGSPVTVDEALSETSVNPVQNKVITLQINAMNELLAQLDEKVFPTTLSVSGGGTYDEGTTQVVTVTWKLQKNGQTLTPDSVTVNGETVDPSVNYKVFTDVTTTTTYRVVVVYKGKTYNGSTTATFKKTYYRYYGALPVGTSVGSITEPMITSLKKEVCTSASATLTYNLEDQRAVYAYPSTFGLLTKVLDDATSMPYDDFVKEQEMVIDGENYYIYALQNPSSVTDYKFRFVK